ncbi:MAG: DUF2892 domain-containing protein [Gemmatimonadaceae bacterium]|nr:DUF2892 domain-containing protein [Gemmatimonadaceae bacterium]
MQRNIGTTDRTVRLVVGVLLLSLAFFGPKTPVGYLGFVFIATALANFCPLYRLFGISTCRTSLR